MKLYSPSQIIISILALIGIYIGYQHVVNHTGNHNWLLLLLALAIAIYLMKDQLDFWWHAKNPTDLDQSIIDFLENRNAFYQSLDEEHKEKFRNRLSLYLEARLFKGIGQEQKIVPEDMKVLVSIHAVEMTLHQEDYLIGDFDRIFLYQHPFGSPQKNFLHIVETEMEDGVIILMLPYLLNAIHHPKKYYNIAYHSFAEALIKLNPLWDWSIIDQYDWDTVEAISGFSKERLLKALGYEQMDLAPIITSLYFTHREEMEAHDPSLKKGMDLIFQ